jgi:hypothetical protein
VTLRTLRETSARPLTALTAALLTAGLLAGCSSADEPAADTTPSASESTAGEETSAPAEDATDEASDGESGDAEEAPELSYEGKDGSTALALLLEADPSAAVTGEGENAFVTTIDGVAANPDNQFWALYVNGEAATVGAGSLETKDGDEITWKLETY